MKKTTKTTETQMAVDLLRDGVFSVRFDDEDDSLDRKVSLPALFVLLSRTPDLVLAGMRPHQEHAVLAFLVYLGAACAALDGSPITELSESDFRERLLRLTKGEVSAWHLFVSDINRPAFLQSPGEPFNPWNYNIWSPSAMDVLFSTDNFSPRRNVHSFDADPEHWVYALISQNGQFIPTSRYRATARLAQTRVCMAIVESMGLGSRFVSFVQIALSNRSAIASGRYKNRGGLVTLWVRPWSGAVTDKPLQASEADPFWIDDPCKSRVFIHAGRFVAKKVATEAKSRIIFPGGRSSDTGDLWAPIKNGKAVSPIIDDQDNPVGAFGYRTIAEWLFSPDVQKPMAFSRAEVARKGFIVFQGIGFIGNGRTGAWNERVIPIDRDEISSINGSDIGVYSEEHVELAKRGAKILSDALNSLAPLSKRDGKNPCLSQFKFFRNEYERRVDSAFLPKLFERVRDNEVSPGGGATPTKWASFLQTTVLDVVDMAIKNGPVRPGMRMQAMVSAREKASSPIFQEQQV